MGSGLLDCCLWSFKVVRSCCVDTHKTKLRALCKINFSRSQRPCVRLVGLRIRLSFSTLSCQRGRQGSDCTMHKLWSTMQAMITSFILCLQHSVFLYFIRNLPFNMPYACSETTLAALNFLLKTPTLPSDCRQQFILVAILRRFTVLKFILDGILSDGIPSVTGSRLSIWIRLLVDSVGLILYLYLFTWQKRLDRDKHGCFFWRKMCSDRLKNHYCGQKKNRKALALLCLTSGLQPNAANPSESMIRELLSCNKDGCFSWKNVFGPSQKPWLWTAKNRRYQLCYVWRRHRWQMLGTRAMCRPSSQQMLKKQKVLKGKFRSVNRNFGSWTFRSPLLQYRY